MKIAFLSRYYGLVNRGAETYVYELSKRLEQLGHEVAPLPQASSLRERRFDVVIGVNGRLDNLFARWWTLSHHAKFIIPGQSGIGLDDRLNLWLFPDVFISLTNYQSVWARKINPFVKIVTIPNGVDLGKFNSKVKPIKLNLPHPITLAVGALEPIKGHEEIIKRVSQTNDSLLIVGRGSLREKISALGTKLLGKERFKIIDFPHDQMPSVYKACDKFVFNSQPWEAFGIVILEARASGLPVEVPNDSIRQEIMSTPLENFSWDRIAKQYDQLFQTL